MEVMRCDRCGKFYENLTDWVTYSNMSCVKSPNTSDYDLCTDCAKDFEVWIGACQPDQIKVKYHTDILPLEFNEKGDWVDLRAAEDTEIWKGESYHIPLGVSMQLPDGYEAHVAPRSSTFKNWGIIQTNSVGVIDNSYCGDNDIWSMPIYATKDTIIHKNDRICQFRIVRKQPEFEFETVEHLGNEDRGGFGSSGVN